ncbi:group III truncated hemoglobin [Cesiribacter sp. SM1]|uniref:group III truncated hemoglobin n=1 Tax=Cesiribacter sp. SM1 TaxID=2861196 RepID=UPI001CD31A33|nr:group III truncated hemoglobin [Cesiribacter sp. SM1]
MEKDITTPGDIRLLVNTFYDKVQADPQLGPVFNEVANVNWSTHLPIMYTFWENLLLGSARYTGRPFPKHAPLPINTQHFLQWINLFEATVNELFSGEKAEEAKGRARAIALVFMGKMGFLQEEGWSSPENRIQ